MATQGQGGNQGQQGGQPDMQEDYPPSGTGIRNILELQIGSVLYQSCSDEGGFRGIRVYSEGPLDETLQEEDVDRLSEFIDRTRMIAESTQDMGDQGQGQGQTQAHGGGGGQGGGGNQGGGNRGGNQGQGGNGNRGRDIPNRGQVVHPETDGRLKQNRALRPHDNQPK